MRTHMLKTGTFYTLMALMALGSVACSATQKGAAIGAGTGAVAGGVIGHQSDKKVEGALIGGGVGAVTGGAIGHMMTNKYCPECGKRYTGGKEYCTEDGTTLRYITN